MRWTRTFTPAASLRLDPAVVQLALRRHHEKARMEDVFRDLLVRLDSIRQDSARGYKSRVGVTTTRYGHIRVSAS